MTTTTANAGRVMSHIEFCHQALWPELDVQYASVTEQWAQVAVAELQEVVGAQVPRVALDEARLLPAAQPAAQLVHPGLSWDGGNMPTGHP